QFFSTYIGSNVDYLYTPPATSCPGGLNGGQFAKLKNGDGSLTSPPLPAFNADPAAAGWVVGTQDPGSGSGTYLSVFKVTKNGTGSPVLDPAVTIPDRKSTRLDSIT